MNLILMPLWLLSGAFFPYEGASSILQWTILLNPVSYAVSAIRTSLYMPGVSPSELLPWSISLHISAVFAILMIGIAAYRIRRPVFDH
jgi:ABC-2 type transport system permease protein